MDLFFLFRLERNKRLRTRRDRDRVFLNGFLSRRGILKDGRDNSPLNLQPVLGDFSGIV